MIAVLHAYYNVILKALKNSCFLNILQPSAWLFFFAMSCESNDASMLFFKNVLTRNPKYECCVPLKCMSGGLRSTSMRAQM